VEPGIPWRQVQGDPDGRGKLAQHNSGMRTKTDRFPLLRFIVWFGGLLAVATVLAMLMARAEADALPAPPPADTTATASADMKR
jgi:hypothetical protein